MSISHFNQHSLSAAFFASLSYRKVKGSIKVVIKDKSRNRERTLSSHRNAVWTTSLQSWCQQDLRLQSILANKESNLQQQWHGEFQQQRIPRPVPVRTKTYMHPVSGFSSGVFWPRLPRKYGRRYTNITWFFRPLGHAQEPALQIKAWKTRLSLASWLGSLERKRAASQAFHWVSLKIKAWELCFNHGLPRFQVFLTDILLQMILNTAKILPLY